MTYTLQKDVILVKVCDDLFLVAAGEARGKVPSIEGITKSGAYFWKLLEQSIDTEDIIRQAAHDYNVSEETAETAFNRFTDSLQKKGYITIHRNL